MTRYRFAVRSHSEMDWGDSKAIYASLEKLEGTPCEVFGDLFLNERTGARFKVRSAELKKGFWLLSFEFVEEWDLQEGDILVDCTDEDALLLMNQEHEPIDETAIRESVRDNLGTNS